MMGLSLELDVPWYNYFIFVPLISIAGAVPLTPGGVGLMEWLYQAFFVTALCGPSKILAFALMARIIPMLWGAPGAVVAVTGAKLPAETQIEAELGIQHEGDD